MGPQSSFLASWGCWSLPAIWQRAALFHVVIYRDGPLPLHPALRTEEPARLCKVPSPVPCGTPGISSAQGAGCFPSISWG